MDLHEILKPLDPDVMQSLTTYTDALAASLTRNYTAIMNGKDEHLFSFALKSAVAGHYVLTATDSFDGKRYTVTLEPER